MCNILQELSPEQEKIVLSSKSRIFINAGFGGGKTRTVIAKVVHLIRKKGIKPHKIMLCTFTNVQQKRSKSG